jgi:hypothetical protein
VRSDPDGIIKTRLPAPRFCYEPVLDWSTENEGTRSLFVACKQPVFRHLSVPTKNGARSVCFEHSPNAKRPTPAGR